MWICCSGNWNSGFEPTGPTSPSYKLSAAKLSLAIISLYGSDRFMMFMSIFFWTHLRINPRKPRQKEIPSRPSKWGPAERTGQAAPTASPSQRHVLAAVRSGRHPSRAPVHRHAKVKVKQPPKSLETLGPQTPMSNVKYIQIIYHIIKNIIQISYKYHLRVVALWTAYTVKFQACTCIYGKWFFTIHDSVNHISWPQVSCLLSTNAQELVVHHGAIGTKVPEAANRRALQVPTSLQFRGGHGVNCETS